jgi:hypothetical protein
MAVTWITPVDVSPSNVDFTWVDIDCSSYVPMNSTGVIIHVYNYYDGLAKIGLRKNGSTDSLLPLSYHFNLQQDWRCVGIDNNRIFEFYRTRPQQKIVLVGYTSSDCVFFINAIDKSFAVEDTWTDIDISANTGINTAIGAMFNIINVDTTLTNWGFRKNGSTDIRNSFAYANSFAVIGLDSNEICEGYVSELNQLGIYLIGYILSDWAFNTNATDVSLASSGSYIDLAALPVGATGGIIEVQDGSPGQYFALRKNGSSEDIYYTPGYYHAWSMVECDANRVIEGKISSILMNFYLIGYTTTNLVNTNKIYSKITIGGDNVSDFYECNVNKSTSINSSSSTFSATLPNQDGRNASKYDIGDDVIVYSDYNYNPPTTKIFRGLLETKEFIGLDGTDEKLKISGRDYSCRLMDRIVEPITYTSLTAGSIVKSIMSYYIDDITTNNVVSTDVIDKIQFKNVSVYDAIKQLVDMTTSNFYVDENVDLHFEPEYTFYNGYTFDNTNVTQARFKERRDTVYNQIQVWGDKYLDSFKETFGSTNGSVYTLLYHPHNTEILVNGSIVQPGAVNGITTLPGSGVKYNVDFDAKQIIFLSGTSNGDNVPVSGTGNTVTINYQRSLPIVKIGDNIISEANYKTRVKVINDKNIKDPATAEQILATELENNSTPQKEGIMSIKGIFNVIPGQSCRVNLPNQEIGNQIYDISEAEYNLTKSNMLSEKILRITVNKNVSDVTDTLKDMILNIKNLQAGDMSTADIVTRVQYNTGSYGMRQSGCIVWERTLGSSFILNNPINGLLGSYANHHLGDYRMGSTILWSGGYY